MRNSVNHWNLGRFSNMRLYLITKDNLKITKQIDHSYQQALGNV
jgi:hypothetical protein